MRTREVGICMALGADAAGVARLLATLLFGVGTFDPVALAAPPLVLGVAA